MSISMADAAAPDGGGSESDQSCQLDSVLLERLDALQEWARVAGPSNPKVVTGPGTGNVEQAAFALQVDSMLDLIGCGWREIPLRRDRIGIHIDHRNAPELEAFESMHGPDSHARSG